jgi:hypothetical protein
MATTRKTEAREVTETGSRDAGVTRVCGSDGPSFYIASSRDGIADVRALAARRCGRGMRCAFPWWSHFHHACSADLCGIADRRDLARREIEAARSCDLFIGVARLGKGSHVELGAALGEQ